MTNDISKSEGNTEKMLTIKEIAEIYNITRQGAVDMVNRLGVPFVEFRNANGGKPTKMYKISEIRAMQDQQQQQFSLAKQEAQAEQIAEKKNINVVATAFAKQMADVDVSDDKEFDNLFKSSMVIMNMLLKKADDRLEASQKRNEKLELEKQQLEDDKRELQQFKEEINYVYNEKYRTKELRAKINKAIKGKCWKDGTRYNEYYIQMFGKYDRIHNFPFREDYRGYLDIIQARGHLKEFYEMILNS